MSETIAALSDAAKVTFIGLWTEADDHGIVQDNARLLKGHLWALDDSKTPVDVSMHVHEIVEAGLARRFEADGRRWLQVSGWHHQKINRPSSKRNPAPPWETDPSSIAHVGLSEHSPQNPLGSGSGMGSGKGTGSGWGSGSGAPDPARSYPQVPPGALGHALMLVAADLATRYAKKPDPDSHHRYVCAILNKPAGHLSALTELQAAQPDLDGPQLAQTYLAQREHPTASRTARCGVCGGPAHPEGVATCPTFAEVDT